MFEQGGGAGRCSLTGDGRFLYIGIFLNIGIFTLGQEYPGNSTFYAVGLLVGGAAILLYENMVDERGS